MPFDRTRYVRLTAYHPYGPLTLTVYTPQDAEWIEQHVKDITIDLHTVRSAIVTIGDSFIVLERDIDAENLHFAAQSYRPETWIDGESEIEVDVLDTYPI